MKKQFKHSNREVALYLSLIFGIVIGIPYLVTMIFGGGWNLEGIIYDSYLNKFGLHELIKLEGWDVISQEPLDKEIQADLCNRLEMSSDDPLCDMKADVFETDFFPVLNRFLKPKKEDWKSFEEIEELLEPYRTGCEEWKPSGSFMPEVAIRCGYLLSGQGKITIFWITFDKSSGEIHSITSAYPKDFQ